MDGISVTLPGRPDPCEGPLAPPGARETLRSPDGLWDRGRSPLEPFRSFAHSALQCRRFRSALQRGDELTRRHVDEERLLLIRRIGGRVQGERDLYRVRAGEYRVVTTIDDGGQTVTVTAIGDRTK